MHPGHDEEAHELEEGGEEKRDAGISASLWSDTHGTRQQVLPKRPRIERREQELYQRRLQTFSPSNFFAKPICLSPILCARFGWQCVDTDVLWCEACDASWAIVFHPSLSARAYGSLAKVYEQELLQGTAHKESCRYRIRLGIYCKEPRVAQEKNEILKSTGVLLPTLFASVFPEEQVQLLEHPSPVAFMSEIYKTILLSLQSPQVILGLDLPDSFTSHTPETNSENDCTNESSTGLGGTEGDDRKRTDPLSLRIALVLRNKDADERIDNQVDAVDNSETEQTAAVLTLLGWRLGSSDQAGYDMRSVLTLECPLCLACWNSHMTLAGVAEENKATRSTINPIALHRYYCPYIAGFPTSILAMHSCVGNGNAGGGVQTRTATSASTLQSAEACTMPLWKSLADRILLSSCTRDRVLSSGDAALHPHDSEILHFKKWEQIQKMLSSGISKKRRKIIVNKQETVPL